MPKLSTLEKTEESQNVKGVNKPYLASATETQTVFLWFIYTVSSNCTEIRSYLKEMKLVKYGDKNYCADRYQK